MDGLGTHDAADDACRVVAFAIDMMRVACPVSSLLATSLVVLWVDGWVGRMVAYTPGTRRDAGGAGLVGIGAR